MASLFASPGMTAMTIFIVVIHGISISFMLLISYEYHHIHRKRMDLLSSLSNEPVTHFIWERRLLILSYLLITIVITIVSLYFYAFQPHYL